jgi:hypothetical protein
VSNPTNPFSWQMPTPTDLVTDLPADFEVFGQAVATSLADLLGGTSGQILAKNSNTDMDFVWIANDQGDITGITASSPLTGGGTSGAVTVGIQDGTTAQKGAVQLENSTSSTSTTTAAVPAAVKSAYDLANGAISKTIVDAKGDLIGGTAADTVSRLAVGANGTVLTADSAEATGLKWAAAAGGGTQNFSLLNSGGTSLSGSSTSITGISGMSSLYILIQNASSDATAAFMSVTVNSDTTAANYAVFGWYFITAPVGETNASAGEIPFGRMSNNAGSQVSGGIVINGCNSSGIKMISATGSGTAAGGANQMIQNYNGNYNGTSTISSVQIRTSGGSFDGGTVYIYGSA